MDLRFQEVVYMPSNGEIIKDVVEQYQKVQSHMKNPRKENAD